MTSGEQQSAVELFRKCSDEAKCANEKLLIRLVEQTKRAGQPLPFYGDDEENRGSCEERTLLPTSETLKSAILYDKKLPRCKCKLCHHEDDEFELPLSDHDDGKLRDYATLILCGCLFITRHPDFRSCESLSDFVHKRLKSEENDYMRIFDNIPTQRSESECSLSSQNGPITWSAVKDLENVCSRCRLKAFVAAYDLKSKIVSVYNLPGQPVAHISQMSERNLPFVDQTSLNIKTGNVCRSFYSCKVHPSYNDPKPNALQGVRIFRKVYAYQHVEETKIQEAKKEAIISRKMSGHDSIAPLLFAFCHKKFDFEVIELLYRYHTRTLEKLLLDGLFTPAQPVSTNDPRVELLLDNCLWSAMVEIVEAINSVHSALKSDATNPLDIKPSNILVDTNEQGEFRGLYLTDFGHIAETTPRKATIEYAPPLPASGKDIGKESPVTYDIWSTACMLLQVLVFIDGDCKATALDLFNSERQRGSGDASFWTGTYSESTLKESVASMLSKLQKGKGDRTVEVIKKICDMFSIDPQARDTMESCMQLFQRTKHTRWPVGQDHMKCGCEKWAVKYWIGGLEQRYEAKLAVYRNSKPAAAASSSVGQHKQQHEKITIDLNSGGDRPIMQSNKCRSITFASSAFWETEKNDARERDNVERSDTEARASGFDGSRAGGRQADKSTTEDRECLWFNSLYEDYTFLFARQEEYRKFVTLVTRQEIKHRKAPSGSTEFRIEHCIIDGQAGKKSYKDGNVQLWYLLPEKDYDSQYQRTPSPPAIDSISTTSNTKGLTRWKLMFWMHELQNAKRVCVVLDIGEKTWNLRRKPGSSHIVIKDKHWQPLKAKMRAAIFHQEPSHCHRTKEEYPFIPIDAAELHQRLKEGIVGTMEITFCSSEETDEFIWRLKHSRVLEQLKDT